MADLVLGLDLGTSCSKVVISDQLANKSYAVEFRPGLRGIDKFLLPTRFAAHESGASLEAEKLGPTRLNLKLALVDAIQSGQPVDNHVVDLAVYFALVLRESFKWFDSRLGQSYRDRDICWSLNLGYPGKQVAPGSLRDSLLAAGTAACKSLAGNKPISHRALADALNGCTVADITKPVIERERIGLYPEIAAQLAGYVKSPYHETGPLLLVDVGAGTLDVSTLILHTAEGDDVCSFHFCEVALMGAYRLFQHRIRELTGVIPGQVRDASPADCDPSIPIPNRLADYLLPNASVAPHVKSAFQKINEEFAAACRSVCLRNIVAFKSACQEVHANGRAYNPFRKNLPFILSGGGSRLDFYHQVLGDGFEQSLVPYTPWELDSSRRTSLGQGLRRITFDLPRNFVSSGVTLQDFDRLSVAYGLAYGAENLMRITAAMPG